MAGASTGRRLLRILLPLGALVLVVAIFVFPSDQFEDFDFGDIDMSLRDGLRLQNPRFDGATADGQPYSLTADWALPDSPDPELVELGPARAEVALSETRSATLRADGGAFRPKDKTIRLEGAVVGETSDGYRIEAPAADGDFAARRLSAEGPVRLTGPRATLSAASMRARRGDAGDVIVFEGRVRLRIERDLDSGDAP